MPCGGIYLASSEETLEADCLVCGRKGCRHYIEEWDAYIHARCAIRELNNPGSEVYVVLLHEHEVYLDFSLEGEEQIDDRT